MLFTPVTLSGHAELKIMSLAPMAVERTHQNKGIGTALVRAGLEQCKAIDYGAVVVLGHPEYYPRFGFRTATRFEIECEYDAPDGVFRVLELILDYLQGKSGTVSYHAAFQGI